MTASTPFDAVIFRTSTTGAGTLTAGAAVIGYRTPAGASVPNATVVSYRIDDDNGGWEFGTGTYTVSGTTLSRSVVASSNANAAISLSGGATVKLVVLAADLANIMGPASVAGDLAVSGNLSAANMLTPGTGLTTVGSTVALASINDQTLMGNTSGTAAAPVGLTAAQARAILGSAFTTAVTAEIDSIGAVSTDGVLLKNVTAAAAGAQQYSPRLHFTGQGWKTTATAASQAVDFINELRPVQGTTGPTTALYWSSQINGGGYVDVMSISNAANGFTQWQLLSNLSANGLFGTYNASPTAGATCALAHGRGTSASPSASVSGDSIGNVYFSAYESTPTLSAVAGIEAFVDLMNGANDISGYLRFVTRDDGAGVSRTERMRITKTGGVNVGAYSADPGAANINLQAGVLKISGTQVVGARSTGWTSQTATPSKADLGASPTVAALASWASAVQAALTAHGLVGA